LLGRCSQVDGKLLSMKYVLLYEAADAFRSKAPVHIERIALCGSSSIRLGMLSRSFNLGGWDCI